MGKSVFGILLGLAAALIWLLRGRRRGFAARRIHKRFITLQSKKGVCGIERPPEDVVLRQSQQDEVHWIISNSDSAPGSPCDGPRQVCVGRWKLDGKESDPPVDDRDNGQHCRTVRPGQTKHLPARVRSSAPLGDYTYEVVIDGEIAVDPIVRLVL